MSTPITVRMYRVFLGDCFLLSIGESPTRHVLIDCGALQNTSGYPARVATAVADIQQITGGRLDVLAITHEHWDHLSGISDAANLFNQFDIGEVWLPWTSNEQDPVVKDLLARRQQVAQGLQAMAAHAALGANPVLGAAVAHVLEENFANALGVGKGSRTKSDVLTWLRGQARVVYHRPGELVDLCGLRCYVLGPPQDRARLVVDDPHQRDKESYLDRGGVALFNSIWPAATTVGTSREDDPYWDAREAAQPFARRRRKTNSPLETAYQAEPWRQIEVDWVAGVADVTSMLDRFGNNTSLAMALERPDDRAVLLFPGDAQVGNWLSWHDLKWTVDGAEVKAADLLARTVLYKVGHHGSENATMKGLGLELMTSPDLVAMVPVETAVAKLQRGTGWEMPFQALYERLLERTRGRVILADQPLPATSPGPLNAAAWLDFLGRVQQSPICYAYALP